VTLTERKVEAPCREHTPVPLRQDEQQARPVQRLRAAPHTRLCDRRVPGRKSGTCDALLCDTCTYRVGEVDLCPAHRPVPGEATRTGDAREDEVRRKYEAAMQGRWK
jgi:hypothetical protein